MNNNNLNAVCPYFAMFPLEYPNEIIKKYSLDSVLDPFCGRGTTNFAARINNCQSVGIDSSKVAYAISSAKMVNTTPERIKKECEDILNDAAPRSIPEGEFWDIMYDRSTLADICAIREALLEDCDSDERKALRGIMLGALHGPMKKDGSTSYLSNQFPRTYASKPNYSVGYWKKNNLTKPPKVSLRNTVSTRADRYYSDVDGNSGGLILNMDSTDTRTFNTVEDWMGEGLFDAVITSPPYLKMSTYIPDQWIRNWFVGGPASVEYSADGQLHSTTERFEDQLRAVWKHCSRVCKNGAHLFIRFGKIGSDNNNPREIIERSLDCTGWVLKEIADAGRPKSAKRQCNSFLPGKKKSYWELDVVAQLK